jgi:RNA polymerase sigma-70 factor (ECF subfamily)
MSVDLNTSLLAEFEQHRTRLFGLAYRMLGMRAEAEDIVQESYLRWHAADRDSVRNAEAWLVTVATRLCIDRLRAQEIERRAYFGEWLPEPIVDSNPGSQPDHASELYEDISIAFLYLLQRLGPEERAAFLLHDVLECNYTEIGEILGKTEAAVRQVVHRARERVRKERPRFTVDPEQHRLLLGRFVEAAREADENALLTLFAENATWTSDGGGKATAAVNVLHGRETLTRFVLGIARKKSDDFSTHFTMVNGLPGLLVRYQGRPFSVYSISSDDGLHITGVYAVLNPDKLQGIDN